MQRRGGLRRCRRDPGWSPTGSTGSLVHYDADDVHAARSVAGDQCLGRRPGDGGALRACTGRQRCIKEFSWAYIAEQTLDIYRKVCA